MSGFVVFVIHDPLVAVSFKILYQRLVHKELTYLYKLDHLERFQLTKPTRLHRVVNNGSTRKNLTKKSETITLEHTASERSIRWMSVSVSPIILIICWLQP